MSTLLLDPQTVVIGDVEYKVRRLSVRDVFAVGRILGSTIRSGGLREVMAAGPLEAEDMALLLIAAFPYAETEVTALCASLIGVEPDFFSQMPPEVLPTVASVLAESEDLKAFFDSCRRMLKSPVADLVRKTKG